MKPLLSILIVTFNRKGDAQRCLDSLQAGAPSVPTEIRVVDNGSDDGTPDWIAHHHPHVHLTRWSANRGLGPALRHLVDAAEGDWFFFLDSDTVVPPGGIDALLAFARENPGLGAVAPRLRDAAGQVQMTARSFPGPIHALFGRQTLLGRLWPNNPIRRRFLKTRAQDADRPFACDWVAFAAVLVRREALEQAGSTDPRFFIYWIDADFFRRVRRAGWEVWCNPRVEILHMEQNRPDKIRSPLAIRDFHRGALRYFYKHHGWGGWNPIFWLGAVGLGLRAALHLLINRWRIHRSGTS